MVNVKDPLCQEPGCETRPNFNYVGEIRGIYCTTHKKEGMMNVETPTCKEIGCIIIPTFNYEGQKKGIYCFTHKKHDMINVCISRCTTPYCYTTISNNKYEGYCLPCFVHMFPDKPNSRNYKTKERAVVEYILEQFPDKTWVADKRIVDGCSRRRPDLCLDMGSHLILIEVDENQHMDYDSSCENKRLMELSLDVGHRPIVFLRFNPDDYVQAGTRITGCWGPDKRGVCGIKKTKQTEWNQRLECLKTQVTYWIENVCEKTVEVVQLFFDQ